MHVADTEVVALIAGAASVGSAWLSQRAVKRRLGDPNGQGSLVNMMATLQGTQAVHGARLDRIDRTLAQLTPDHQPS